MTDEYTSSRFYMYFPHNMIHFYQNMPSLLHDLSLSKVLNFPTKLLLSFTGKY